MIAQLEKFLDRNNRMILDTRQSTLIIEEDISNIENLLQEYKIGYAEIRYDSIWEFLDDSDSI